MTVADPPESSVPMGQVMLPPVLQPPRDDDAELSVAPAGTGAWSVTPVAVSGPAFVTDAVTVNC